MAYSLSNISIKNYWNWTTTLKIIDGGWGVYFFETECIYKYPIYYIIQWVHVSLPPNGISISSAIFVGLTQVTNTQDRQTDAQTTLYT